MSATLARRTAIGGIPESADSFTYDPQGNCRRKADLRHRSTAFRRSAVTSARKQWNAYHQSLHGTPEIGQARTHNRDNQLTQIAGSSAGLAYDGAGQMTEIPTGADLTGPPRALVWNAWGHITQVKDGQGTTIQTNKYDALGRRTTRAGATTTSHLYYDDQWRVIERRKDASTTPDRQHIWHPADRYTLILRDRDTDGNGTLDERLYQLKQHLDPAAVIDASGAVQERYQFTAFGRTAFLAPDYSARASSSFGWDVLFHVELADPETGWMNYGFRFYAPELGRWISRDPMGKAGGVNLYGFVYNDPIVKLDWLGLFDHHLFPPGVFDFDMLREFGNPMTIDDLDDPAHRIDLPDQDHQRGRPRGGSVHHPVGPGPNGKPRRGWNGDWQDWVDEKRRKGECITRRDMYGQLATMRSNYADYLKNAQPATGNAPSPARYRKRIREQIRRFEQSGGGPAAFGALFVLVNGFAAESRGENREKAIELIREIDRLSNPIEAGDDTGAAANAGLLIGDLFGMDPNLASAALLRKVSDYPQPAPDSECPKNLLYRLFWGDE